MQKHTQLFFAHADSCAPLAITLFFIIVKIKYRIQNKIMEDLITNKIELANGIVEKLAKFQDIDGALKVKRNIIKEIHFLQKVNNNSAFHNILLIFLSIF